jgi:hypothetical protein
MQIFAGKQKLNTQLRYSRKDLVQILYIKLVTENIFLDRFALPPLYSQFATAD